MDENKNIIEGFAGITLHPSLDIKDGVLVLGFRYHSKLRKVEDLILLVWKGTIRFATEDSLVIEDKEYFIEKKGRRLIWLQERWSIKDLNQFIAEYADVRLNVIPEPKELFEEIKKTIKDYVGLEKEVDYSLAAAWIVGTYFHPIFSAYPFLNVKAPKHSGKSQFLNLLKQLCFNAVKSRPSVAALGDTVDALRGTFLVDQADGLKRKGGEELLDIFADSYKGSGGKRRIIQLDKEKQRSIVEHSTYGPKVFASIQDLPEDLRDRCLIIPLLRSHKNFFDPDEESDIWGGLRGKLYKFLIGHGSSVAIDYSILKVEHRAKKEISGRTLELWLPFEVMFRAMNVAEEIPEARKRFLSRYDFAESEPSELDHAVLAYILEQFKDGITQILLSPRLIAEALDVNLFDRKMSSNQIAARVGWSIKNYNMHSEKKRKGEGNWYLFEKAKVELVRDTYFSTPSTPEAPDPERTATPGNVDGSLGI